MMEWIGRSTIIKDGETLKTKNYTYEIVKLLNDGASIVYKARRSDGKDIFLKQFKDPNHLSSDWEDFIEFQHSILNTLIQLPQNIVEVNYEYFEFQGTHFHAKGFEDGKDLSKTIWEDKPNFKDRINLIISTLGILNAVHKKGVVHSDLKPQQFFIIPDETLGMGFRAKLIDFDHCMIPSLNLSRPAGTAEWRSPEHIKNSNIGFHSDSFTMGQIVYTLLTGGRQPYAHSISNDTYDKDIIHKKGYVELSTLFSGKLPESLVPFCDMVDSMMDPDYKKRPTIEDVHKEILKAVNVPKKPKYITLESNGKSRLIVESQIISRDIVKSSFGNHEEIYNKQFELMKDNHGDWYIKGIDVPSEAKDASGKVYHFYKTHYNGKNVTNTFEKLEEGGEITVGKTTFLVKLS